MKIIGLTGGIASGKSTIATTLKKLGAEIINADKIAREIVVPGTPAWREIVKEYGQAILLPDKNINRKLLANFVFQDEKARKRLNEITHPRIIAEVKRRINTISREKNPPAIVIDAPLLIEAGMTTMVDDVWLAELPESLQIKRLMKRDNLTLEQAQKRIKSQMPLVDKRKFAQQIIDTSGSLADTISQVRFLWNQIVKHENFGST